MTEFILASQNQHKAQELTELLSRAKITVKAGPEKIDVIEDGSTFRENAYKKAQAYFQRWKRPILADDSGLIVEALPDDLGVQTARFGGEGLSDQERCIYLLDKLVKASEKNRKASFICVLCFIMSKGETYFFEGHLKGQIASELKGKEGFGYDPVFLPEGGDGKSLAEIPEWKSKHSHRALAVNHALRFFSPTNIE